jgi:peptide/nickel transport system substrate-binding protein
MIKTSLLTESRRRTWAPGLLMLITVLIVACGAASPAAPDSTAAPAAEPTAAPIMSETAQPTPTPQMAAPPAEAEVEVNPGRLTIMVGDLGTERFESAFTSGTGGNSYLRTLHGWLISDNEKREMVPGIASDWNLSADGLTWTFTIREGVKFHDGSEVTAEDVLWTLQHMLGPQANEYVTNTTYASASRNMNRIELSGPDEVSVTTKEIITELANYMLSEASCCPYGTVLPKRAELHDTEEEVAYDNNPIGAGPMSLEEHVPSNVMRFERFHDFYYQPDNGFPEDKRVNFQSLDLFMVPEEATRVSALRSGEADIVPASLATKEQVEAGGGRLVFGQEGTLIDVRQFGCYIPQYPCHDKRVRQALEYAIDKELMRDTLFGGPEFFQIKGWSVVTPSTIGYTPKLDPWPFDPDKARQLLADAGYPGGKGFGKLIVNTNPPTAMPFLVESAQLAADMWRRELGLDVEVRVTDDVAITKARQAGELFGQIQWAEQETRTDATGYITKRYGDPKEPDRLTEDPELNRLTQESLNIVDLEQRAEASKELYARLKDESYYLAIGYSNILWAVGPRVVTWQPYPMALYPSALHTITLK